MTDDPELIALSALHHWAYCRRHKAADIAACDDLQLAARALSLEEI